MTKPDLPATASPDQTDTPPSASARWAKTYDIRSWRPGDDEACLQLYRDGLLGGQLASNDTGLDIDDIETAYGGSPLNHFWVATVTDAGPADGLVPGDIVGMIGVQHHDEGVGEIRRLRVHGDHRRRRIGSRLLSQAIGFCRNSGCMKVALDTYIQRDAAMQLFDDFHFHHGRTRNVLGKDMLYFYLDLYRTGEG